MNPPIFSMHELSRCFILQVVVLYLGAGLGLLKEPETMKKVGGSFEGSLGYEWDSGVFLQINGTRLFHHTSGAKVWPGLTLGYGF